jgi:hypothetical protein
LDDRLKLLDSMVALARRGGITVRILRPYGFLSVAGLLACTFCGRPYLCVAEADRLAKSKICSPECQRGHDERQRAEQFRLKHPDLFVAQEQLALQAEEEADRRRTCPRPDKVAWKTKEAAEQVVVFMRDREKERSENLHGYLCDCGYFHVGDRTRRYDDPVIQRWGPAPARPR